MKKLIISLFVICSLLLVLSGCSSYGELRLNSDYTIFETTDGGETICDGTNTYYEYGELPLGVRLEHGCFAYYNPITVDDEFYNVFASSPKSGIRYLKSYVLGISAYVTSNEDRERLDAFVSGDASAIRVIDYYNYTCFDADMELVNKLDALSEDSINVPVRKLSSCECYDIVYFDEDDILAYTHGAIYNYGGELYYINYDKLGNNYFDSEGRFSFGRGTVDMYKLSDSLKNEISEKLNNMDIYSDFYTWEDDIVLDEDEMSLEDAIVTIVLICLILGVVIPLVPLTIGVIVLIRKRRKVESSTYVLIGASAIWIIAGILLLILSL